MRSTLKRYTLVMAAVLLAACGGDDDNGTGPGGNVEGSFTGAIAGDITGGLSGLAGHGGGSEGGQSAFVFAFEDTPSNNTATASILFTRSNAATPTVGEHAVVMFDEEMGVDDFFLLAAVTDAAGADWICVAEEGTIDVTSASASRIRGSFEVAAQCIGDGGAEKALTLTGNFDSRLSVD